MKQIIHLLWLTIGLTYCNLQAQYQNRTPEVSINLGVEYDLLNNDNYLDGWFPRLSFQYKQFELGGFYYLSNEIRPQKNSNTVELPDLHSEKSKFNVFVKYYPIKDMGFNCELGFNSKHQTFDNYNFFTAFEQNVVTKVYSITNSKRLFKLKNNYNGYYLAIGYSHKIIKGLFIDSQVRSNFGQTTTDVYADEKLTDDANDTNKADIAKHKFYLYEISDFTSFWDLTLGLTYKFGLK